MGFLNTLKSLFTNSCPQCGANADSCSVIKEEVFNTPYQFFATESGVKRYGGGATKETVIKCKVCGFERERTKFYRYARTPEMQREFEMKYKSQIERD